ncbi:hypothetical protein BRC60_00900 [Halobacteriales archaeon QH_1_68_42]|nr:MAG: hypothetical protein BRC60_00900 [Halobacteriales archaeon QH_1_68_42]
MLLVLCVDLDDDLGRKTDVETPVVGRDAVRDAAVALAEADPEDSDVNVLFEGVHIADRITDESVEVAAVTGADASDVAANRAVGEELDTVLAGLTTGEDVRALVVTDGAQDESVLPVIRSRVAIDGLGILLLIYPLSIVADALDMPGAVFGVTSGLLGIYLLSRGLALGKRLDQVVERGRSALFTGRVTLVTSLVALILLAIGGVFGTRTVTSIQAQATDPLDVIDVLAALVYGSVQWFAAAGVTSSLGRVVDEYLDGEFEWEHLNAPVYVLAIAFILHGVGRFLLGIGDLSYLAFTLTGATLLGLFSTFAFALAESRFGKRPEPT